MEALRDAMRTVAPGGLLAVHLSNRYYDLAPAVACRARDLGLAALRRIYAPTPAGKAMGAIGSIWMILARDPALLAPLARRGLGPRLGRRDRADHRRSSGHSPLPDSVRRVTA